MPVVRSISEISTKKKTGSARQLSKKGAKRSEPCSFCRKVMSWGSDLKRHMLTHNPDAVRHPCTVGDCKFKTLQKSNLKVHIRRHLKKKSIVCTDDPSHCGYGTWDGALLLRHRKKEHDYIPGSSNSCKTGNPTPSSLDFSPSRESEIISPFESPDSLSLIPHWHHMDSSTRYYQEDLPFLSSPPPFNAWDSNSMSLLYEIGFLTAADLESLESGPSMEQFNGSHGWFGLPM